MKSAAIYLGVDTGSNGGSCITQPAPLKKADASPAVGDTVFIEKIGVMKGGDKLTPVTGATPPLPIPVPCVSQRIVIATSKKVLVNKKPLALELDLLNSGNNIKIAKGAKTVFAA